MTTCRHVEWKVPYEPGTLRVQSYKDGSAFATDEVATHSEPVAIKLTTDWPLSKKLSADNTDTALVTVSIVDSEGRVARSFSPDSSKKIKFTLAGQGKIIGKGNGDPSNHEHDKPESTKSGSHSIFNGLARLVVQSTHDSGSMTIKAEAEGLKSDELTIQTIPSTEDDAFVLVV